MACFLAFAKKVREFVIINSLLNRLCERGRARTIHKNQATPYKSCHTDLLVVILSLWRSIHTKNGEWIAEFMDFSLRSK